MIKEDEISLENYMKDDDFIKYNGVKALFHTKLNQDMKHNGEIVEVLGVVKTRLYNAYTVRFQDGTIERNIYPLELDFDYEKNISKISKKPRDTREER